MTTFLVDVLYILGSVKKNILLVIIFLLIATKTFSMLLLVV